MFRIAPALLLTTSALFISSGLAHADPRTSFLVEQLKNDDQRVRAQAALALGASGDDASVQPLCNAVSDKQAPVRVAAAASLGKLAKATGQACLQAAEKKEKDASVKAQIQKSVTAIKTASTPAGMQAPPPPDKDAKFYIAVDVMNKTSRPNPDVELPIRGAMQMKLLAQRGYAVAPKGEVATTGGQIIKSKRLKGFLLSAVAEPPVYEGTDLKQTVRITVWGYPSKVLKAEFAVKLSQSNTTKGDTKSEDALLKMCAESAIDNFLKVAENL